jgi:serine/threonine protein kinase
VTEQAERPRGVDPLRLATPRFDDVEARRARASVANRLFGGPKHPVHVGRYQILGRIGTGGMGVVYRAHDPELARDVAVKLMNAEAIGDDQTATARARLIREARAMARLAHPNVIHVYDVGVVEDGVFIAMELVEGMSLAAWQAPTPEGVRRDWRDVLRRYVDAGRGLAAAHAAGIVHRDFKPENVLVGSDGRVRVGDFGLAGTPAITDDASAEDGSAEDRAVVSLASSEHARALEGSGDEGIATSLTRTGAVLGTPKYMAPEQEHGALANARSDQFSFCVALFEGLYGRAPFDGDTVARYRRNVRAGRLVGAPIDTKVRGWIYAEIIRGLAVDPAARHPGLDALLDRLERALVDPRVARRGWVRRVALSVPLVGAALGIGAWVGANRAADDLPVLAVSTIGAPQTDAPDDAAPASTDAPQVRETGATVVPASVPAAIAPPAGAPTASPADAATTTPTDARPATKPGSDAKEAVRHAERPTVRSKRPHCFFHEDEKSMIARQSRKATLVRDEGGGCYRCRPEKNQAIAETMTPDEGCTQKYACMKESPDTCNVSSPG